jgi:hypothetical protein
MMLLKAQVAWTYGRTDGAVSCDQVTKGLLQVGFTFWAAKVVALASLGLLPGRSKSGGVYDNADSVGRGLVKFAA